MTTKNDDLTRTGELGVPPSPQPAAANEKAAAHTPGPWNVDDRGVYVYIAGARYVRRVASTKGTYAYANATLDAENAANARLIAAAPDYWNAAEELSTDCSVLEGDDAGYVAVSKSAYEALMLAHAKAAGR